MTVTYSNDIATARFLTLLKLLFFRWRGSVMKLIWKHLLLYLAIYYTVLCVGLLMDIDNENHENMAQMSTFFEKYEKAVPISFVLGFFVSAIMTRWWSQFSAIPWPYGIAVYVSSNISGFDEVGRAMRRTIMRYVCLSLTMVFRVLSPRVKARFPKFADLVDAGLLYKSELKIIEQMEADYPGYSKNWVPIVWAASLVNRARAQGRIRDDFMVKTLIKELNKFRGLCGDLLNYNAFCIPLVYVQVVTIVVYCYFFGLLFASQIYEVKVTSGGAGNATAGCDEYEIKNNVNPFPVLAFLQFIFYMGWLKVAETMINPFGVDDDDFEVNSLIDHNMIMSYLIVDVLHNEHPELLKDQYWNSMPGKLPDIVDDFKPRNLEMTEIFDVVIAKQEKRVTSANLISDLVSPKSSAVNIVDSVDSSFSETRIPTSNIDENYLKVQDVDIKQNNLEREMKRRREEILGGELIEIETPSLRSEVRSAHASFKN